MSASDEWRERHLTPSGWVDGSYRVDGVGTTFVEVPTDRILTVRYSEYSGWGANIHRSSEEKWRHADESHVKELLEKFGEAPNKL